MITIDEQNRFVRSHLAALGRWLEIYDLADRSDELLGNTHLKASIEAAVADVEFFRTKNWDGILRLGLYRVAQYALVRSLSADTVVETGVLHGLTSAFILEAMSRNGGGKLVSIDLPSTFEGGPANQDGFDDTLPPELPPGWVIDEKLRAHWDLRTGSSQEMLPAVCRELREIDIFLHDSEHTYQTMEFEFETIWPALRPGGLLVADNIDCNTAFFDFCRRVDRMPYIAPIDPDHARPGISGIRFGIIRKQTKT